MKKEPHHLVGRAHGITPIDDDYTTRARGEVDAVDSFKVKWKKRNLVTRVIEAMSSKSTK